MTSIWANAGDKAGEGMAFRGFALRVVSSHCTQAFWMQADAEDI